MFRISGLKLQSNKSSVSRLKFRHTQKTTPKQSIPFRFQSTNQKNSDLLTVQQQDGLRQIIMKDSKSR